MNDKDKLLVFSFKMEMHLSSKRGKRSFSISLFIKCEKKGQTKNDFNLPRIFLQKDKRNGFSSMPREEKIDFSISFFKKMSPHMPHWLYLSEGFACYVELMIMN